MKILPKGPHRFFYWWFYKATRHIFVIGKRIMVLFNNQFSFTLNIRLLFTPLFGDYTLVGRIIGFFIRIGMILTSFVFIGTLSIIFLLILPIVWILIPLIIFSYSFKIFFLVLFSSYLVWEVLNINIPLKRASQVNKTNYLDCIRPLSKRYLINFKNNQKSALLQLFQDKDVIEVLKRCELYNNSFTDKIMSCPSINPQSVDDKLIEICEKQKPKYLLTQHIFLAIITNIPKIDQILSSFSSSNSLLNETTEWVVKRKEQINKYYIWHEDYELIFTGGIGKGMLGRVTPYLDMISTDFTKIAGKGKLNRIVGREEEIKKIAQLLAGSKKNLMIIGPPGCGKTSIVKGIAHKIMEGTQYQSLRNKRIVSLEIGGILAGSVNSTGIAEKLRRVIKDVQESGDIILFIDEIHNLVAGSDDKNAEVSTIYSLLEPYLAGDKIQFIGATSIQNYRKYIEPNGAFSRLFQLYEIQEASKKDTLDILKYSVENIERKSNIYVTYLALDNIVNLSEKLIHERVLPDKALDILSRTITTVSDSTNIVNADAVKKEISIVTEIPVETITQDEASKLLNIEQELKKSVIGQDKAIKQIGISLKRARVGMRNESKPIASFLFVGTTGVGKTQTAKALAKSYFGNSKNMIRLDMSEYQQIDSINRLIGTPDGLNKGFLTDSVRDKPFSLILLDEIEKAHPNILLTFLQVLDEGTLTDSSGIKTDFTNTIIIATSNVGTKAIQDIFVEQGSFDQMNKAANKSLSEKFAPEFLNRFTSIIVFNPLTKENIKDITNLLLSEVTNRALNKGVKVTYKEELVNKLTIDGYDPIWGARPLARLIENSVETYIAVKMLSNELRSGDEINLGLEVFNEEEI